MDMGANNMIIVSRKPTHPGEMLREEFFPEFGLSVSRAAELLHVSSSRSMSLFVSVVR